jgi:Skp family chaperone for outer membrane proteins
MKSMLVAMVGCAALGTSAAYAQGPTIAPQAQLAAAFPAEARVAYVDVDRVAMISAEGRAASARLNDLRTKKSADLEARSQQVEALQNKLTLGAGVLNEAAMAALRRDFQRARVDFQRASEDAQADVEQARQETMQAFGARLFPIIGEVASEKKIWAVFGSESGLVWHDPATDLSEEVARRLDAGAVKK